jgi:hypothetical protein
MFASAVPVVGHCNLLALEHDFESGILTECFLCIQSGGGTMFSVHTLFRNQLKVRESSQIIRRKFDEKHCRTATVDNPVASAQYARGSSDTHIS